MRLLNLLCQLSHRPSVKCVVLFVVLRPPAVASDVDLSALEQATTFATRNTEITELASSANQYTDNVALINQTNASAKIAYAYIDQSGGSNNFASISQDATTNAATAAIMQVGTGNRAIVNQH